MLGWLAWFWLDKKNAVKSLLSCIILRHIQKAAKMINLTFHIRVQQTHIAFSSAPENIILATKLNRSINGILDLGSCIGERMKVGIGCSAIHIARVREHVCSSP